MNKNICEFSYYDEYKNIKCKGTNSPCLYQRYCTQDSKWWVSDEYGKCKTRRDLMSKNKNNKYSSYEKTSEEKKTITLDMPKEENTEKEEKILQAEEVKIEKDETSKKEILTNKAKVISKDGQSVMVKYSDGTYGLIPINRIKSVEVGEYIEI